MKNAVLKILTDAVPNVDFETNTSIADDGLLDSLNMISIISKLNLEFSIKINMTDISTENFNSLDDIVRLVETHVQRNNM